MVEGGNPGGKGGCRSCGGILLRQGAREQLSVEGEMELIAGYLPYERR